MANTECARTCALCVTRTVHRCLLLLLLLFEMGGPGTDREDRGHLLERQVVPGTQGAFGRSKGFFPSLAKVH